MNSLNRVIVSTLLAMTSAFAPLAAHAEETETPSIVFRSLDLNDKTTLKVVAGENSRMVFMHCPADQSTSQSECTVIGRPSGYTREELQERSDSLKERVYLRDTAFLVAFVGFNGTAMLRGWWELHKATSAPGNFATKIKNSLKGLGRSLVTIIGGTTVGTGLGIVILKTTERLDARFDAMKLATGETSPNTHTVFTDSSTFDLTKELNIALAGI